MFTSDYRFYGNHADMVDDLLIPNGGFFDTVYDAFFTAAIVGLLDKTSSSQKGDRTITKTIFADKFTNEYEKTKFIVRTLIFSDENELNEEEKINRSLRNFDNKETAKMNRSFVENYAFRGIEILHDRFISNKKNTDAVTFVDELIKDYTSEDNSYESIHNLILEMSKGGF